MYPESARAAESRSGAAVERPRGRFHVDEAIEAQCRGGPRWFQGCIAGVNLDGTYDVQYEDGDHEQDVPSGNIRRARTRGSGGGPGPDLRGGRDREVACGRRDRDQDKGRAVGHGRHRHRAEGGAKAEARHRGGSRRVRGEAARKQLYGAERTAHAISRDIRGLGRYEGSLGEETQPPRRGGTRESDSDSSRATCWPERGDEGRGTAAAERARRAALRLLSAFTTACRARGRQPHDIFRRYCGERAIPERYRSSHFVTVSGLEAAFRKVRCDIDEDGRQAIVRIARVAPPTRHLWLAARQRITVVDYRKFLALEGESSEEEEEGGRQPPRPRTTGRRAPLRQRTRQLASPRSAAGRSSVLPLSARARRAVRRLRLGSALDPQPHLQAFIGLPATFHRSALACAEERGEHSLADALKLMASGAGFGVGRGGCPPRIRAAPAATRDGAEAKPRAASDEGTTKVVVTFVKAKAIPAPGAEWEGDVRRRTLRVGVWKDPSGGAIRRGRGRAQGKAAGARTGADDDDEADPVEAARSWIGNICTLQAAQDERAEENWRFDVPGGDRAIFASLDHQAGSRLYLVFEMAITMAPVASRSGPREGTLGARFGPDVGGAGAAGRNNDGAEGLDDSVDGELLALARECRGIEAKLRDGLMNVEASRIEDAFVSRDDDDSGEIGASRLRKALKELKLPVRKADIGKLVELYDDEGKGAIRYEELIGLAQGRIQGRAAQVLRDLSERTKAVRASARLAEGGPLEEELSCGFAMIPLAWLAASSQRGERQRLLEVPVRAGAPWQPEDIRKADIQQRRYGWRRAWMRMAGAPPKEPKLVLKVAARASFDARLERDCTWMPRQIILPVSWLSLVRAFRDAAACRLAEVRSGGASWCDDERATEGDGARPMRGRGRPAAGDPSGGVSACFCDASLALFPAIMSDAALAAVANEQWHLRRSRGTSEREAFLSLMRDLGPVAASAVARRPSAARAESLRDLEGRKEAARRMVALRFDYTGGAAEPEGVDLEEHALFAAFDARELAVETALWGKEAFADAQAPPPAQALPSPRARALQDS